MAQQSARRGRKTRAIHGAVSTLWVIWIRSANSHTGPQPLVLHQRPDRWQHPTTCNLQETACVLRGVHRWIADRPLSDRPARKQTLDLMGGWIDISFGTGEVFSGTSPCEVQSWLLAPLGEVRA